MEIPEISENVKWSIGVLGTCISAAWYSVRRLNDQVDAKLDAHDAEKMIVEVYSDMQKMKQEIDRDIADQSRRHQDSVAALVAQLDDKLKMTEKTLSDKIDLVLEVIRQSSRRN